MYKLPVSGHHHLNDTSVLRQKSHLPQLNWRGPVFLYEVLFGSLVCVCVCVYVRRISFLYRLGGLMCAWDSSPQRRVNLRHLLCTSSIFLDSWHFTSWTNCQLSKLNFRNDMSKFTPPPSPEPLLFLLSSSPFLSTLCLDVHLRAFTCVSQLSLFPNKFTHLCTRVEWIHMRTNEVHFSSPQLHPAFWPSPKVLRNRSYLCKELNGWWISGLLSFLWAQKSVY